MTLKTLHKIYVAGLLLQLSSGCVAFKIDSPFHQNEEMNVNLNFGRFLLNPHNDDRRQSPAISLEFSTSAPVRVPLQSEIPLRIDDKTHNPIYIMPHKTDNAGFKNFLNDCFEYFD